MEMVNNISQTQCFWREKWGTDDKPSVPPRSQVLENKHICSESVLDLDCIVIPAGFWHVEQGDYIEYSLSPNLPLIIRRKTQKIIECSRMWRDVSWSETQSKGERGHPEQSCAGSQGSQSLAYS